MHVDSDCENVAPTCDAILFSSLMNHDDMMIMCGAVWLLCVYLVTDVRKQKYNTTNQNTLDN